MRGLLPFIILLLLSTALRSQQRFAFTHITTDDGIGLASNHVTSLYQDEKGFFWIGTANGLQRFDGSKFIQISTSKAGSDQLLYPRISQIIPADGGKLVLGMFTLRKFGLFDPATFVYNNIALKPARTIPASSEYRLWKDSQGEIYLNVDNYGILHYNKRENAFVDDHPFPIPRGWTVSLLGNYENVSKQQYWFACDKGLCIYDKRSGQMWYRENNPNHSLILANKLLQSNLTKVYIDRQQRIWVCGYPTWGNGGQYRFCFDSTGSISLKKDTLGLNNVKSGYADYKQFYETKQGELWIYGLSALLSYNKNAQRFEFIESGTGNDNITIDYESVFQVLEDKDGNIWLATNEGIYYTATGSANSSVVNVTFNDKNGPTAINDILETSGGELLFASGHKGVTATDKFLNKVDISWYTKPPPAEWPQEWKDATLQTWSLATESKTGNIWTGCVSGVLMISNIASKTITYLHPPEIDNSRIQYITEDNHGQMWLATEAGRLVKCSDNKFTVVRDIGTIIYKVFIDKQGWMWLATRESGLYAIDPATGQILQHYTANAGKNSLYSNTGTDIEQLGNNLIVFAGGALHFINKNTGSVSRVQYEDGLPSNTVLRLRMDEKGFLWIITSNGLCRYNPNNKLITPYGRRDGIVLAELTIAADYSTSSGNIIFGGSNSVIMFNPAIFSTTQPPPDVTITDFKLFNQYLLVDSLLKLSTIKLQSDQNSLSIYFASLSYTQRDKLTYFYKLEGIDKDWVKADRSNFVNYSLLPPGKYTYRVYCENIEGLRCTHITELGVYIKPPYYKTWWFISCLLLVVALLIYEVHSMRLNRLLAVETLRNRVARDLHDDMGSTLSTINILSSMARNKIQVDNSKTSEYLSKISEYSERMMDAMDDIVWSIKPSNDSMQKIAARMREFATNVLEAKQIDFECSVDEDVYDVKLNMEARRDFFLIFKEAVNNSAKYSRAGKLILRLMMKNKKLLLIVKDDGIGFDLTEADGNGLGNMQKRADQLNGHITIESKKGHGTSVNLTIPVV
ncbi:MAG: histidine kinase [Bacteroidota bacterium]|nr:histidine kinase [Bacteroidota bacterium]